MNLVFYKKRSSCLVAKVTGELDLSSATLFRDRVDQELRKTGIPNLILNLKGLTFVDSTGLGAILGRHKRVTSAGGKLVLVDVPPKIISMLEMAGLLCIIPVTNTQEEAIKVISGQSDVGLGGGAKR